MFPALGKQFLFNYGWDHFWYDPKSVNNSVREFIKGSFAKPKLVCSIPFVTRCQDDGTPVEFSEGISDCWAEYLNIKFKFFQKYLKNYELMHREDVDVVPHLRKYRLYIGQGIPDPWTSFPYTSDITSHLKDTEQHKRFKNKKEDRCLCCEREYLFECPDKCDANRNRCSCTDCHGKCSPGSGSSEKCRCSEIFHSWLLGNSNLHRRKHKRGSSGDCASTVNGSHSEWEEDGGNIKNQNKFIAFCECYKNKKGCQCSACENLGLGAGDNYPNEKTFKYSTKNDKFLKQQSKVYFCPYVKNFYRRKSLENEKSLSGQKKTVSKEIQTEIEPIKSSKIVQTEQQEKKTQPKCTCHNKCFSCSILCNKSGMKKSYPAVHSIPNFCCSASFRHFVCPCLFVSHCPTKQHCQNESSEQKKQNRKKKQTKERECEEVSNFDQYEATGDKTKLILQQQEPTEANCSLKYNRNIYNYQTPSTALDHLKLLADYKLKGYLQQDEMFPEIFNNKFAHQNSCNQSKFMNYYKGNSLIRTLKQEGVPLEQFKSSSYYKPKYSESSFAENFRQSNILTSNIRRINYCNQTTMTPATKIENAENHVLVKDKIFKSIIDSNEPKPCGFHKNHEVPKVLRKRRKLLRNRKRRRKLVASIQENQESCTMSPKQNDNVKEHQIEGTSLEKSQSKKFLNQNYISPSKHLNFGENSGLKFTNVTFNPKYSFGRNKQEIPKKTPVTPIYQQSSS